jgi:DNA uptake protein ComE-like DNA-binding protein
MQKNEKYQFLIFTKKEKRGIFLIIIINILLYSFPFAYQKIYKNNLNKEVIKYSYLGLEKLEKDSSSHSSKGYFSYNENGKATNAKRLKMFEFDPNTISKETWMGMGVSEKTATTIEKYISKGGRFREAEDLKKIWGLKADLLNTLMPYVRILPKNETHETSVHSVSFSKNIPKLIDINNADSVAYESLRGIGPTLAKRIVTYRNKLRGFYSVDQVAEVWGLHDSIFQSIRPKLKIDKNNISPFRLNDAPLDSLKSHPYFGFKIASLIVNYRKQHGTFKSLEEIQKIDAIDIETYRKIIHYLVLE